MCQGAILSEGSRQEAAGMTRSMKKLRPFLFPRGRLANVVIEPRMHRG